MWWPSICSCATSQNLVSCCIRGRHPNESNALTLVIIVGADQSSTARMRLTFARLRPCSCRFHFGLKLYLPAFRSLEGMTTLNSSYHVLIGLEHSGQFHDTLLHGYNVPHRSSHVKAIAAMTPAAPVGKPYSSDSSGAASLGGCDSWTGNRGGRMLYGDYLLGSRRDELMHQDQPQSVPRWS
jgi:hypothetical protein